MRELRRSPDGNAVAIRSDEPEDSNRAFGVMQIGKGGWWARLSQVEDWEVL